METEKKGLSAQEEGKSSAKLLERLAEQLRSSNASTRRQAAFNLSWMQEDGLELLKGTVLSNVSASAKNAAAYGLRKMRGRMKKPALDVLRQGLKNRSNSTREVCAHALSLMGEGEQQPSPTKGRARHGIQEIPAKRSRKKRTPLQRANPNAR